MTPREALTVRRILKVNHAGEYSAIRIYRAQIWVARHRCPDALPFLEEALGHELKHCDLFREAMRPRGARPCRVMSLWGNGGYVLGFVAAVLGRNGIWVCTAAVEATVHRHLLDQLHFLKTRDSELHDQILEIMDEELMHLKYAEERISGNAWTSRAFFSLVSIATDTLIWLSTWGDSSRMSRDLVAAKAMEATGRN